MIQTLCFTGLWACVLAKPVTVQALCRSAKDFLPRLVLLCSCGSTIVLLKSLEAAVLLGELAETARACLEKRNVHCIPIPCPTPILLPSWLSGIECLEETGARRPTPEVPLSGNWPISFMAKTVKPSRLSTSRTPTLLHVCGHRKNPASILIGERNRSAVRRRWLLAARQE